MRHRLATQVRQSSDICIFCALRWSGDGLASRSGKQSARRTYSSSVGRLAPAGAVAAVREDDEDAFPMLKQNAAASAPAFPSARPANRGAPLQRSLPPEARVSANPRVPQQDRTTARRPDRSIEGQPRRDAPWRERDAQPQSERRLTFGPRATSNDTEQRPKSDTNGGFRIRKTMIEFTEPPAYRAQGAGRLSSVQGKVTASGRSTNPPETPRPESREVPQISPRQITTMNDRSALVGRDQFRWKPPENLAEEKETSVAPQREKVVEYRSAFHDPTEIRDRKQPQPQEPTRDSALAPGQAHESMGIFQEPNVDRFTSKFRNDRFSADEEEEPEADLPTLQPVSKGTGFQGRSSRNKSSQFDFDAWEAEQSDDRRRTRKKKDKRVAVVNQKPTITIPGYMSVSQLAQAMKVKVDILVGKLEDEGFEGARYDHMLDAETSAMFADQYGFDPIAAEEELQDLVPRPAPEDISDLPPRPPIVTIMGHVDHGKTTILDWLRKSSVVAGEHGGITQHIGAFSVTMPGSERQITFLDTPGHEAFLDMRKRGANVTDIVVLVVAADDSVKPQTVEAIKHALDAQVQLIVAINKVDKHDADIERVKQDLTRHDIVVEDFGGDYQAIAVSGKTGQGMEQLEEAVITLADVLDLRAEQDGPAEGQIIESKVTNAGRVATILVKRGRLRVGDFIVAGPTWGRVRTLRNDAGKLVDVAYPGDPVQVDGWRGDDPTAGLEVIQADNEQHAKDVVDLRQAKAEAAHMASEVTTLNASRSAEAQARAKVLEWEAENNVNRKRRGHHEGYIDAAASSGPKKVHFVVKADVAGSVEAIVHAISAIGNHEVQSDVIHSGTGPLTESDVRMLATSDEKGYAISFNQPIENAIKNLAFVADIDILDHNIIYRVTETVKEKVQDALPPLVTQRVLGEAEVGQIFEITLKKRETAKIAGCKITNGTISRANKVRVIRAGETVYTGTLGSLKNVKRDVTEMRKGSECGLGFDEWEDVQVGDQVQCFEQIEEKRKLY